MKITDDDPDLANAIKPIQWIPNLKIKFTGPNDYSLHIHLS